MTAVAMIAVETTVVAMAAATVAKHRRQTFTQAIQFT
jgi:hypothetical protein